MYGYKNETSEEARPWAPILPATSNLQYGANLGSEVELFERKLRHQNGRIGCQETAYAKNFFEMAKKSPYAKRS